MNANLKFIGEVENAIANGSLSSRTKILGRVTDLFVAGATRLSDEEVALFDDVITRLAVEIEISRSSIAFNSIGANSQCAASNDSNSRV